MHVVNCDRLGSKIQLATSLVKGDSVQLVSAVTWRAGAAGIGQEVGEHLITPTGPVLIWVSGEHGLHIRPRIVRKYRGTDEDQVAWGLTHDWLAQDIHVRDFDIVQSPSGDGNCAHHACCVIHRRIEASKRFGGRDTCDIYLNLLRGIACSRRRNSHHATRSRGCGHLKYAAARTGSRRHGDVGLIGRYRPAYAAGVEADCDRLWAGYHSTADAKI